jgi:hypothetical protein
MNTRTITTSVAAAALAVLALAGCAAEVPGGPSDPPSAPRVTTSSAAPTEAEAAVAGSPAAGSTASASALADHWYRVCSAASADAGVAELRFDPDPAPYRADGGFVLTYGVARFADGHTDPYAAFVCSLDGDGIDSVVIGGGVTDTH